jgi:hypothetical protein
MREDDDRIGGVIAIVLLAAGAIHLPLRFFLPASGIVPAVPEPSLASALFVCWFLVSGGLKAAVALEVFERSWSAIAAASVVVWAILFFSNATRSSGGEYAWYHIISGISLYFLWPFFDACIFFAIARQNRDKNG